MSTAVSTAKEIRQWPPARKSLRDAGPFGFHDTHRPRRMGKLSHARALPTETARETDAATKPLQYLVKFQDTVLVGSWRPPVIPQCRNRKVSTWMLGWTYATSATLSRTELSLQYLRGTEDISAGKALCVSIYAFWYTGDLSFLERF
jgi:hypothetical protein